MSQSPLSQATDDRLANMLFQGEEVEEEFTADGARVAVTTHRVLVFTPDGDANGRRFDHADRPNVVDATVRTSGRESYVGWGARVAVYGVVLLGGGFLLKSSGIVDEFGSVSPPDSAPAGGIVQFVDVLPHALAAMTDVFLLLGGLLLLVAGGLLALYFGSRSRELVIERSGRDPIRVPVRNDDGERIARRLRTVVGTASKPSGD